MPAGAFKVAALPEHTANVPEIAGVGLGLMTTAWEVVPVQPLLFVTVTVYVPVAEGLMVDVVAPLLQA